MKRRTYTALSLLLVTAGLLVFAAAGCTDKQLAQAQAVNTDAQATLNAIDPGVDLLRSDVVAMRQSIETLSAKVAATTQPAPADVQQLASLQGQLDATAKVLAAVTASQKTLQDAVAASNDVVSQLRAASTQPSPGLAQAAVATSAAAGVASAIPVYGEIAGGVLGIAAVVLGALAKSNAAGKSDALAKLTAVVSAVHTNAPDSVTADVLAALPPDVLTTWNTIRAALGHYAVPPGGTDTAAPATAAAS